MKMKINVVGSNWLLLILIFAWPNLTEPLHAQLDVADTSVQDGGVINLQLVKADANRRADFAGVLSKWVDPMEAGERYRFKLSLLGTGKSMPFDRVESSCQCGKLSWDGASIDSDKALNGELLWHSPKTSTTGHATIRITFYSLRKPVAEIRLFAYLSNCVNVGSIGEGKRIDDELFEWKVPIAVTTPITFDSLSVELSEELNGFSMDLKRVELFKNDEIRAQQTTKTIQIERAIATIRGARDLIGNRFRFGTLLISTSEKPNKTFAKELAFSVTPLIRISPMMLEFKKQKKKEQDLDQNETLKFNALIQFDERLLTNLQDTHKSTSNWKQSLENGLIKIELTLNDSSGNSPEISVELTTRHLGRSVFRVTGAIDGAHSDKEKFQGNWTVVFDERQFDVRTVATINTKFGE